jgi:hypothetical protein
MLERRIDVLSVTRQMCRVPHLPKQVGPRMGLIEQEKELSMGIPYRARVNESWFLNLPGLHAGAYVVAYVEDTSEGVRAVRAALARAGGARW